MKEGNIFFKFAVPKEVRFAARSWDPAADIYDASDGWLIKIELPGISRDDFEISIKDKKLYLSGVRRDKTSCREGLVPRQVEITYSRFEKTFFFPDEIEESKVEYQDGFLYIYVKRH
ncbi:MAG: Hsp20/alpha crystallin family protein [Pyrinomonadaceae bacterium]|nr:Hsp20/alpha crystallin family protein [Pyrinomonadaceae bacterium]MCX7639948.1 Hsp20/alpha crystallin family protein [Pyrinomonadaceae bacterium]MDW8304120.1 Hsp20/alpha crystallin family protein [Acidobacteriota bacterium]